MKVPTGVYRINFGSGTFSEQAAMRRVLAVFLLAILVAGCGTKTQATYQVSHDSDRFEEIIDGKLVQYANWQFTIGNKTIDIPHKPLTIVVRRNRGHVDIDVNGKSVYTD